MQGGEEGAHEGEAGASDPGPAAGKEEHAEGDDEDEGEEDPGYAAASKAVGASVAAAFEREGLEVRPCWRGGPGIEEGWAHLN